MLFNQNPDYFLLPGLDIFEAYGMTESASIVTPYNHYHCHVTGSVGTAVNKGATDSG